MPSPFPARRVTPRRPLRHDVRLRTPLEPNIFIAGSVRVAYPKKFHDALEFPNGKIVLRGLEARPGRLRIDRPQDFVAPRSVGPRFRTAAIGPGFRHRGFGFPFVAGVGLGLAATYPYYYSGYYSDPCVVWDGYAWVNVCPYSYYYY
jgi:hypothetical protein